MRTLTPIISILVSITIFFGFTKPMFEGVRVTQQEIKTIENLLLQQGTLNQEVENKLKVKRNHSSVLIEKLDLMVPKIIDEVHILSDLDILARSHKMLMTDVGIQKSNVEVAQISRNTESTQKNESEMKNAPELVTTDISFSLTGTYDQFKAFVADIEQSLTLLEFIRISFSAGEGSLQRYDLTLRAFSLVSPNSSLSKVSEEQ